MIDKLPVEKGAEDIVSRVRASREARKAITASETSPDASPAPSATAETDPAAGTGPGKETKSVEVVPPIVPKPDAEPAVPKPEDLAQAELNQAINDFEAKQSQIAEMRAKKTGRFASLGKALGIKPRNIDDDPEVMGLEKESHDLYRGLLAKGIHLYKGDKAQLENFLKQFDEFEVFKQAQNQEMEKRAEVAGFPENILAGFQKIGQKWSELSWKQKIAIGAAGGFAIAGGALALGAGTFGAAALGAVWRWGFRGFGAMAVGVGRKVQLDVKMIKEIEKSQEGILQGKLDILKRWGDNIDEGIEEILAKSPTLSVMMGKNYEQRSLENSRRARNLALKSFAISSVLGESFRYASQATGINLGSIIKKIGGYAGFGGGTAAQQAVEHLQPSGSMPQDLSPEEYARIEKVMASYGPGHNMNEMVAGEAVKMHAGGVMPETEVKTPEIVKPKLEDIAEVKIKAGGNMWVSIENNIKANPSAYGLDQADPNFKTNMNGKISEILHDFAKKNGLSYKQLDKVFEGDNFKIGHDATGKPYLYDFHGKAFGADVSHGGGTSAAQEISSSRPRMAVDDMKPRAGMAPEDLKPRTGVADHQPARGGGKVKVPQEIQDWQDRAQANSRAAIQAEQNWHQVERPKLEAMNDQEYARAHIQQVNATGRGINRLFEGAGVSEWSDALKKPMSEWNNLVKAENYIAQDVGQMDAVNKVNPNLNKLRNLYPILKKYSSSGSETIGECLSKAMKDSKNVYMINKVVLTK